jgi:hypothetical protein
LEKSIKNFICYDKTYWPSDVLCFTSRKK